MSGSPEPLWRPSAVETGSVPFSGCTDDSASTARSGRISRQNTRSMSNRMICSKKRRLGITPKTALFCCGSERTLHGEAAAEEIGVRPIPVWWTRRDSNPRPPRCERGALPTEPRAHILLWRSKLLTYNITIARRCQAAKGQGTRIFAHQHKLIPESRRSPAFPMRS